jgi:hypothetical protein
MRHAVIALAVFCWVAPAAVSQAAPVNDPLLERLAGTWVLRGTIAGQATTHDIVSEWVLGHEYLQIHELSREKDDKGKARYEAIVLIGWDAAAAEYQCLWLDSTGGGGLSAQAIGRAKRSGDAIPFLFKEPDGSISFNNTFSYDKGSDSWTWQMDNVRDGKAVPFGRVRLTRQ